MEVLTLLLLFGAAARVTRFINDDTLAESLRGHWRVFWIRRLGPDHPALAKAAVFISCPWCVSVWVATALTPLAYHWGDTPWFTIPAVALSISWVYAVTATHLDGD